MENRPFPFFALSLFLLFSTTSCVQVKRSYYPSGKLESEIEYRWGKEEGKTVYYDEYTQLPVLVMEMKRGKKEGKLSRYFPYGQAKSEENYVDDLLDGVEIIYSPQGFKMSETHFVKGLKNGSYTSWHARDMVKEKGFFKDDKFDGEWEYYDDRGMMVGEGIFDRGAGTVTAYDPLGNLQRVTHYADNQKEGDDIFYYPNGEVETVRAYHQGRIVEINGEPVSAEDWDEE